MSIVAINISVTVNKKGFEGGRRRSIAIKERTSGKDQLLVADDEGKIREVDFDDVKVEPK